jgi:hypothetical protein
LDGARDAIQVLTAFIEDLSTPTSNGLPDYLSPEPVVVSRAMTQLRKLTSDATLGVHTADISRANLHGISLPNYRPQGALLAVAADFRRANLHGLVLSTDSNSFRRAFLTCTDLSGSTLVNADLQYADLSGADLRGADLGHTRNLTSAQLTGAMVNAHTVLPPGVTAATTRWGIHAPKCATSVNQMTGMIAGQGYDPELPCPLDRKSWPTADARKRFTGVVDDLVTVCRRRRPEPVPPAPH